jgi:hypothetical protein
LDAPGERRLLVGLPLGTSRASTRPTDGGVFSVDINGVLIRGHFVRIDRPHFIDEFELARDPDDAATWKLVTDPINASCSEIDLAVMQRTPAGPHHCCNSSGLVHASKCARRALGVLALRERAESACPGLASVDAGRVPA